jgi:hypothetical protein
MKRAALAAVFFIILCHASADENTVDFKTAYFKRRLFNFSDERELSFMNLNPVFFGNSGGFFFINFFESAGKSSSQSKRAESRNSQDTEYSLLGEILILTGEVFRDTYLYNNRQARNIYNDALKQREEIEKLNKRINPNYGR